MKMMNGTMHARIGDDYKKEFYVVHPLFDKPEKKLNPDELGKMKMTKSVKFSLVTLRFYLIGMIILAFYRILEMSGAFH